MSEKRIGVFDSGVGCLSILKELFIEFPHESFYVFGDSKNNPYGVREDRIIKELTVNAYKIVESLGIKACVIASNTSTIYALDEVQKIANVPVVGVIEPGVDEAIKSKSDNILIMGTPATIKSEYIKNELLKRNPSLIIDGVAGPKMELLAESGEAKSDKAREVVYEYLDSAKISPDCVMLSCTHFPVFEEIILDYYREKGKDIKIINPARATALKLREVLTEMDLLNKSESKQEVDFYTSGDPETYKNTGNLFLDGDFIIDKVNIV